jgi:dTDP-glucose 4,6-dehydratase
MALKVLVTGGFGFIGSNFIRHALETRPDWKITNLDCLSYSGNPENLTELMDHGRHRPVIGNVQDRGLVMRLVAEHELVIHFAAESHVDRSIADARAFMDTNVSGTLCLLDAFRAKGSGRLVQVSTDEVYGSLPLERPDLKFTELTSIAPSSPYSASKAAADGLVGAYHHTYGLDAVITRCSNNFGPWQFPEKVIPLFITKLMEGQKVPLYGDGQNVRDWLHVIDHCEAIIAVAERGRAGEVYNVGGDNECSNIALTHMILDALGKGRDQIEWVTDRLGHDRRYAIDSSKLQQELGWRPVRSSWPQALTETIQWYIDNQSWWKRVQGGQYRDTQNRLIASAA